ncbi:DUF2272 domain-containing protein [Reyranella sp. CPCC 100927]|uniref:DUF2272 domain-containing protein n=1 Tax=Reyranella sp. CPCC 100927 TaxID=2599616 RepID=UPI0015B4833B|nr:DUF2272 domain-containing protein [Reyranella sp. CPCC 100927]
MTCYGRPQHMNRLPTYALLVITLLLAACATTSPPAPAPETGDARERYAPGTHQALLAWLDHEWKFFGDGRRGHIVDLRRVGPPEPPRWPGVTPEQRLCDHLRAAYWTPVTGSPDHSELSRRDPATPPACTNAWSAVFISSALRNAGVQPRDFRFDPLHSAYLKDIQHRYRTYAAAPDKHEMPLFVPHPLEARAPQPGDLICATRRRDSDAVLRVIFLPTGPRAQANWDAALDDMAFGHCDIVVAVDLRRRTMSVIGGNVQDTTSKSLLPIDASGRPIRTIERPWFIVIENRLP